MTESHATVLAILKTHVVVTHDGKDWDLGNINKKFNVRLWRYKLHHYIHHRKEK